MVHDFVGQRSASNTCPQLAFIGPLRDTPYNWPLAHTVLMANSDCTMALPEVLGVMHRPAGLPPLPFEPVLHSKALRMLARYSRGRG